MLRAIVDRSIEIHVMGIVPHILSVRAITEDGRNGSGTFAHTDASPRPWINVHPTIVWHVPPVEHVLRTEHPVCVAARSVKLGSKHSPQCNGWTPPH